MAAAEAVAAAPAGNATAGSTGSGGPGPNAAASNGTGAEGGGAPAAARPPLGRTAALFHELRAASGTPHPGWIIAVPLIQVRSSSTVGGPSR